MDTGAPLNLPLIENSERSPEVPWATAMAILNAFAAGIQAAVDALQTQVDAHETRIAALEAE